MRENQKYQEGTMHCIQRVALLLALSSIFSPLPADTIG